MSNPFSFDNFNSFISQATQTISCGTECQKQKTAEQLKQTYLNSQTNLDNAPNEVQVAQKNYVTFTQGEQAYNDLNNQQLEEKAKLITSEFQTKFNAEADSVQKSIQTYSGLYINLSNVYDLYNYYKKQNDELFSELKDESSDTLTNERKTYYEDQGIDSLNFWYYYILLVIYIIVAVCFGALSFIYPSTINWKYRIAIMVGLIILPFISTYLLDFALMIIYYVYSLLPTNVRLTVEPSSTKK